MGCCRAVERADGQLRRRVVEFLGEHGFHHAHLVGNFVEVRHRVRHPRAAFAVLRRRHPQYDLYRLLRTSGPDHSLPREQVLAEAASVLEKLRVLEARGEIRLAPELKAAAPAEVLAKAIEHFDSFHDGETLKAGAAGVYSDNVKLLYYYRNRLDHYG